MQLFFLYPILIKCESLSPFALCTSRFLISILVFITAFSADVPLLTTYILYHTIGKMSSGNFAQTFSGKMPRSVQIAQNGLARPSPSRPVFRTKRKSPEQVICSGILLRGLSCGKSDLARSPSSVNSLVEVFQHVLRIVIVFIIIHYNNLIYPIS